MSGKNSRSSKTAHVLNLLSGGTPEVKPDAVPPSREAPPPAPLGPGPPASVLCGPGGPAGAGRRRLRPLLRAVSPRPFWRWPAATMLRCQRASTLRWNPHFRRSWPPRSRLPPPLRSLLHLPLPQRREKLLPRFWTLRPPLLLLPLLLLPLPLLPCRSRHPQSCQTAQSSSM